MAPKWRDLCFGAKHTLSIRMYTDTVEIGVDMTNEDIDIDRDKKAVVLIYDAGLPPPPPPSHPGVCDGTLAAPHPRPAPVVSPHLCGLPWHSLLVRFPGVVWLSRPQPCLGWHLHFTCT